MRKWIFNSINVLVTLHLFLFMKLYSCHDCKHKIPKLHEVVHGVYIEPHHVMKRRAIDQPLRIHLHYDDSLNDLPIDKQNLIKDDLIPSSISFWQSALQVRHTSAAIQLHRQCVNNKVRYKPNGDLHPYCTDGCNAVTMCGETVVPPEHLDACRESPNGNVFINTGTSGPGVEQTDFILYISAHNTHRCDVGTTVAYSAYCQQEAAFDRPVAGYVNMCPDDISTKLHALDQMHSTMRHEILHALGFSVGLFAFFRDEAGEPLTPRNVMGLPPYNYELEVYQWSNNTVKSFTRDNWVVRDATISRQIDMVLTPRVLEEARRHFNCSSLEGAELEDQDALGTALSHWEKRIFENEAMTGGYTQSPVLSRLTLALMEDTGWYKADYSRAQPLAWGAGLGCEFAQNSCLHWMNVQRARNETVHPFCDYLKSRNGSLQTQCTDDHSAVAVCNLGQYPFPLPPQYQYFDHIAGVPAVETDRYAGSVVLADYCPFIQEFNWNNDAGETVRRSTCQLETHIDVERNYLLEDFGPNSMCFKHASVWSIQHCSTKYNVDNWGSGCYKMRCDSRVGLVLTLDGVEYQCLHEGDIVPIKYSTSEWHYRGSIVCPACATYCKHNLEACAVKDRKDVIKSPQEIPCKYSNSGVAVVSGILSFLHLYFSICMCVFCL